MFDQLPDDIIKKIIHLQILIGDYNPAIFCKLYKKNYDEYVLKNTKWFTSI